MNGLSFGKRHQYRNNLLRKGGPICVFLFLLSMIQATGQSIAYDSSSIPAELRKNASRVVRFENIQFELSDISNARLTVHRVVTIMNIAGKSELFFAKATDKFISLQDVDIRVFNPAGKQIAKYKQSDLNSVAQSEGLIDDYKYFYLNIPSGSFPVTIDFKYEIRYRGIISYPPFEILIPDEGVEFSSYTAKVPKDLDLRYKEKNIRLAPEISEDGKYKIYNWSVKNLAPIGFEEGSVSYESRYPSILLAPNHFKVDEYEGDMSSWKNFGFWYGSLKKGMDQLPESRKPFYQNLIKDAKNEREKVKIIYEYLQENFRYVSIQLGIGGFRPFAAEFTEKQKYGDCKGLSNYMQAALDAIGIKSYQALINASYNKEPVDPAFPCNEFNHVIVCVPESRDSIWLECTSKTTDFGSLGSFTENRNALLITDSGGVLISTPKSKSKDNTISAYSMINLNEDGSGKTNTQFTTTGEYTQDMIGLGNEKTDDQKTYAINHWGFKDPSQIIFHQDRELRNSRLEISQDLDMIPELKAGKKMFLPTRIYNLWSTPLPSAVNRRQDFFFTIPFERTDTTVFKLTQGYRPEALPEPKNNSCPYASFVSKYWYDEKNKMIYSVARIVLIQNRIPASGFAEVKRFFDALIEENAQRIVIKKED